MTAAWYVYAIGRPFDPAGLAGLAGIDDADVHAIALRNLVAVVSAAPSDETALRARLERLDELAAVAVAHDAVVAAVATQTVVVPFRLATIYRDEHRVRELLHQRRRLFETLLDRLTGTVEIGVKLYVQDQVPARAPSTSGRAYLRQLSQRSRRRDIEWHHAAAAVERIDNELGTHARARHHHRPQPAQLWPAEGHNVLNAAYLVPTSRVTEFTVLTRRLALAEPVLRVEVTGPWAPVLVHRTRRLLMTHTIGERNVALVDLLDRLLEGGVVLSGDLTLAIADVDLVRISLRALIRPVEPDHDGATATRRQP